MRSKDAALKPTRTYSRRLLEEMPDINLNLLNKNLCYPELRLPNLVNRQKMAGWVEMESNLIIEMMAYNSNSSRKSINSADIK